MMDLMEEQKPNTYKLRDGKEYTFPAITMTSLANVEKTMGVSGKKLKEQFENIPLQTNQLVLWAFLAQNYPNISRDEAGNLIGIDEIKLLREYLITVIALTGL